jgi:hypothetical protein
VAIFELDVDDYLAAQRLNTWRNKKLWMFHAFNMGLFILVGFFLLRSPTYHTVGAMVIAIMLVSTSLLAATLFFLSPWLGRRAFTKHKTIKGARACSWTDDTFTSQSSYGAITVPWADFVKFAENDKVFLLYTSPRIFICIPKRTLSAEESADLSRILSARARA